MIKFIINADDYGISIQATEAIASLFKKQLITRTTMVVNYIENNESSITIATKHNFIGSIGLHINIYDGKPLTDAIKNCPDFVTNDIFNHRYRNGFKRFIILDKKIKDALAEEFDAQFKLFKQLTGNHCSFHFDSHHHIHTEPSIWKILKKIAKKNGFKSTRISQNIFSKEYKRSILKNMYKSIFNKSIKRYFASSDYFCSAHDFLNQKKAKKIDDCVVEIMCHPVFTSDNHFANELEVEEIGKINDMMKKNNRFCRFEK